MARFFSFFVDNFPSLGELLVGAPLSLAWGFLCLSIAGRLRRRGLRVGYTRKTFHFLVFGTAAAVHVAHGTSAVCLFGGMVSLVVLYAILRGEGHRMYDALAREKDAPHATYYIVVPWIATAAGGILANVYIGDFAVVGYLVGGIADAIAEPVGTRWGKHRYRVPIGGLVPSERSLEGSASVGIAACFATTIALMILPGVTLVPTAIPFILLIGVCSMLIEAVSPHGWDNLTMQIVPALLAGWMFPLTAQVS